MASCSCLSVMTPRSRRIRPSIASALLREGRYSSRPARPPGSLGAARASGLSCRATEAHARAHRPLPRAAPGPRARADGARQPRACWCSTPRRSRRSRTSTGRPPTRRCASGSSRSSTSRGARTTGRATCSASTGRAGLRFLFLLDRKRRRSVAALGRRPAHRARPASCPRSCRTSRARRSPTSRRRPALEVGHGLAVHNPLLHTERVIERALRGGALAGRPPAPGGRAAGARAAAGHPAPRARGDRLPADPAHAGGHDHGLRGALARAAGLGPRVGRRALRGRRPRTTCWSSSTASAGSGRCCPRPASPRTRRSSSTRCPPRCATRSSAARR